MAGLLDFLQSASNSAASNVSAPVDGIAWLLRKAGLDVGEPMGGSDWMQRQGLTKPVKQGAASLAGETAGLLSPMLAAAKAPQIARGLLSLDDKAMDMARQGMEGRMDSAGMRLGAAPAESRGPVASAEWAGTNTPARIGENYANDMMQLIREDVALKDFDPAMVRRGLVEWSQNGGIHPGHSLRAFMRQLTTDTSITPARKQKILSSLSGGPSK